MKLGRAVAIAIPFFAAACAAVSGLSDFEIVDDHAPEAAALPDGALDGNVGTQHPDSSPPGDDDASSPEDAGADADAPIVDSGTDTGTGPGTCTPPSLQPNALGAIVHLATTPTIDGKIDEWPCSAFVAIDKNHAGQVLGNTLQHAEYALGWTQDGVYFACHVFDQNPPEGTNTDPFRNDACELYLGSAPAAQQGRFQNGDLHYVVDYASHKGSYDTNGVTSPPNVDVISQAKVVSGGFIVEVFVPWASGLGGNQPPSAGTSLLLDVQIDDDQNNMNQVGVLTSYYEPVSSQTCSSGLKQPTCDTRLWGTAVLK